MKKLESWCSQNVVFDDNKMIDFFNRLKINEDDIACQFEIPKYKEVKN